MVTETLDTAAPEAAVTADPVTEAPPSDLTVETPETAEVESPETVEQPEAPETEAPRNPLDDLDEDSLLEHPKVKDILARREESARRKAEHEANTRKAAEDLQWTQARGYVNDLADVLRGSIAEDEDGKAVMRLDPSKVEGIINRVWATNVRGSVGVMAKLVHDERLSDFKFSSEDTKRLQDAYADFNADPVEGGIGYFRTLLDLTGKAAVEAATPDLRKAIEKDIRKEFETKAEADSRQKAEATARNGGSPTNLTGDGPTHRSDAQLIEIAGSGGSLSAEEWKRLETLI